MTFELVDSLVTDVSSGMCQDLGSWQDCLRSLKHGGHAIVICGAKNYHRVACAMEDSGFEIRDSIMWVYSSEDGDFSSIVEPIVLARKPLIGSIAENVVKHGTGGINIDGCRVGFVGDPYKDGFRKNTYSFQNNSQTSWQISKIGDPYEKNPHAGGRWPANLIHDGSDEVRGLFPEVKGPGFYKELGDSASTAIIQKDRFLGMKKSHKGQRTRISQYSGQSGSSARFFYCAPRDPKDTSTKPLGLLRYLCRLITPPNGIVFDPFPNPQTQIEEAVKMESFSYHSSKTKNGLP